MKTNSLVRITTGTCCSLLIFAFCLAGTVLLPDSWGAEDGPLEWLQFVILVLTAMVTAVIPLRGYGPLAKRKLAFYVAPAWLMAAGRELSWGRVLYTDSTGGYIGLQDLWYGPLVHPFLLCLSLFLLWNFYQRELIQEIQVWLKNADVPYIEIALILCSGLIATGVEHYSFGLFGSKEELFEELAELVCYSSLFFFMIDLGFNRQFQKRQLYY